MLQSAHAGSPFDKLRVRLVWEGLLATPSLRFAALDRRRCERFGAFLAERGLIKQAPAAEVK